VKAGTQCAPADGGGWGWRIVGGVVRAALVVDRDRECGEEGLRELGLECLQVERLLADVCAGGERGNKVVDVELAHCGCADVRK